jgi:catalase
MAAFLQHTTPVPVTIRFSNGSGVPTVSDNDPSATPHGFAIKYHLSDGTDMDTLAQSVDFFPARTGEDFATLLSAIAVSGPGAKKPAALDAYLAAHPIAKAFLTFTTPPPVSFGTLTYFGINAFKFTDSKGIVRYGRYLFRPWAGGVRYLPMSAALGYRRTISWTKSTSGWARHPYSFLSTCRSQTRVTTLATRRSHGRRRAGS